MSLLLCSSRQVYCFLRGMASVLSRNGLVWPRNVSVPDWRDDAEYLADLIPRVHPNAFAHVSRESFQSQVTDVETTLKSRTQTQRVMSLVRLVALLGDGHSTLLPFQPATGFGMLALQI